MRNLSLGRAVLFCLLLGLTLRAAHAAELTQDDIDFRKEVYVNKQGDELAYRLYAPLGYDKAGKYPLLV